MIFCVYHSYHTVPAMSLGPYVRPRGVLGGGYNSAQRYGTRAPFTVSNLTPPYAKFQIWNLTGAFTHRTNQALFLPSATLVFSRIAIYAKPASQ